MTVLEEVTVQPTATPNTHMLVPSEGCAVHGIPIVAPVTVAVPDVEAPPRVSSDPPIDAVVPLRYAVAVEPGVMLTVCLLIAIGKMASSTKVTQICVIYFISPFQQTPLWPKLFL